MVRRSWSTRMSMSGAGVEGRLDRRDRMDRVHSQGAPDRPSEGRPSYACSAATQRRGLGASIAALVAVVAAVAGGAWQRSSFSVAAAPPAGADGAAAGLGRGVGADETRQQGEPGKQ